MYRKATKRSLSEFPRAQKIVIVAVAGIICVWIVAMVVSAVFFPGLYR